MTLDDLRTSVRPGPGIVARFDGAVLVVPFGGGADVDQAAVDDLLEECGKGSLADRLDDLRAAAGDGVPSFAVVVEAGDGLAVFVAGEAQAAITGAEPVLRLSGRDTAGWTGRVHERFASLAIGVDLEQGDHADSRLDLRAGVVPGSSVVLLPPAAPPGPAREPEARPEPAAQPVVPAAPAPEPQPEPVPAAPHIAEVWGIRCKKGHFNDPEARYCGMCGIHTVQESAVRVKGPRPVLGFLVLDDGTTYKLDTDYVIGSDPHRHDAVVAGKARPLVVAADGEVISPVHARVVLQDWDVLISDCHSVYGTYVWTPGTTAWERLKAEHPVKLGAGSQVMVAQRGFMFQPVNKR